MKAISIKQPWASLIANGIKDIENRTWATKYRGKILIHASAISVKTLEGTIFTDEQWKEMGEEMIGNMILNNFPKSAIIGEVDIVDCVINHESIWAEKSEFQCCGIFPTNDCNPCGHFKSEKSKGIKQIYNWVLANPVLYEKPILNVKGKLSFWEFEK